MNPEIRFQNTFGYEEFAFKGKYLQSGNTLWAAYNDFSFIKFPLFDFSVPSKNEIKEVFQIKKPLLISYSEKTELGNHNAYLYLCSTFNKEKLKDNFVRNVKKAEKLFTIKLISPDEMLKIGLQCYIDTRQRIGLDDGTEKAFFDRFIAHHQRKNIAYVAAFAGDDLASFASVMLYKNFVEIESIFGKNDHLPNRPNDLLIYTILNQALNADQMQYVSYGFASIQENSNEEGLHQFKIKCGFEAIPVKRIFKFHPVYGIFFGSFTKILVKQLLKLFKKNTLLRKLNGILNHSS